MAWPELSDLQNSTVFFTPTHKFPIRLRLMINLLEGMHPSNESLSIRDSGMSENQTEFQTADSLTAIFSIPVLAWLKQKLVSNQMRQSNLDQGLKDKHTWVQAHPHTSRWILQSSRSAGCSGRVHGGVLEPPGPSGCCRLSAALSHWCNHWTGCRSYQLFLEWQTQLSGGSI